jgi:hypothetical protein
MANRACEWSSACEWIGYAMLRDDVQRLVEGGVPTERFAALHEVERAVAYGGCTVDAARLRADVLRAWYALWMIPRVRAVAVAGEGPLLPDGSAGWEPVSDAAKRFVAVVLELTEHAVEGDRIDVHRDGSPPCFSASLRRSGHFARTLNQPAATGEGAN